MRMKIFLCLAGLLISLNFVALNLAVSKLLRAQDPEGVEYSFLFALSILFMLLSIFLVSVLLVSTEQPSKSESEPDTKPPIER